MSTMTLLMVFAAATCGWTLLSVLSGERYRRVRQMEIDAAPREPEPPSIPIAQAVPQSKKLAPKAAPPQAEKKPAAKSKKK